MARRLPEPMLARAGELPTGGGWWFEPKLDGFRSLVCTHGGFRARSRRRWNMAPLLPELRRLPPNVQLDGEIVAFDEDGRPDFHRLSADAARRPRDPSACSCSTCSRAEGGTVTHLPYGERRDLLEALELYGPARPRRRALRRRRRAAPTR